MSALAADITEAGERFECFGGTCAVRVQGPGPAGSAGLAAERIRRRLLAWHAQFSRFERASELSRLNRDPRRQVPVSAMMARFVESAVHAAGVTGGLVDPTLVDEVEQAGYAGHFDRQPVRRPDAEPASPARPAVPDPRARWRRITVDRHAGTVSRPVGVRLDSGGIAKGLFGDVLATVLSLHESFAIEAAGDIRFGGSAGALRPILVTSPFDEQDVLHTFELARGAVATSGTTKRSWIDDRGRVAHHLLDPITGRPAFTGIVQATAIAPTGVAAEALAKAALLSGPAHAAAWLHHGGVLVYDGGSYDVIEARMPEKGR